MKRNQKKKGKNQLPFDAKDISESHRQHMHYPLIEVKNANLHTQVLILWSTNSPNRFFELERLIHGSNVHRQFDKKIKTL